MTFLALGYPYMLSGYLLLVLMWFFIQRKIGLVLLVLVFFGYKNLFSSFAFSFGNDEVSLQKDSSHIRILSWNVQDFTNSAIAADSATANRRQIMEYIKRWQPDIICLQDFSEMKAAGVYSNIAEIRDSLQYPYHYFCVNINKTPSFGQVGSGVAIFSRYPIVDSGIVPLPQIVFSEHLAYVDVMVKQKPLRVYNTHLTSMQLFLPDDVELDTAWQQYDNGFIYRATMFDKLRRYDQLHVLQAEAIKKKLAQSPHPFMFCADLNTTPAGHPYHIIKDNLQDAFIEKGFGLGNTYVNKLPTIRIDYILTDKSIQIQKLTTGKEQFSDHYPVLTDIRLPH